MSQPNNPQQSVEVTSKQESIAPGMVLGVRHRMDCACLNTPAGEVARRPCNCGALLREIERLTRLADGYRGMWHEAEQRAREAARLRAALARAKKQLLRYSSEDPMAAEIDALAGDETKPANPYAVVPPFGEIEQE